MPKRYGPKTKEPNLESLGLGLGVLDLGRSESETDGARRAQRRASTPQQLGLVACFDGPILFLAQAAAAGLDAWFTHCKLATYHPLQ